MKKFILPGIVLLFVIASFITIRNKIEREPSEQIPKTETTKLIRQPNITWYDRGVVCAPEKAFSFRATERYSLHFSSEEGLLMMSEGVLAAISKGTDDPNQAIITKLNKLGLAFTKEGDRFVYTLPPDSKRSDQTPPRAISVAKDNFAVTVFYPEDLAAKAQKILETTTGSLKGGCGEA